MRSYPWFEAVREARSPRASAALTNEREVNAWRFISVTLFALGPLISLSVEGWTTELAIGLSGLGVGVAYASLVWAALKFPRALRQVQYTTVVVDVTLVTGILFALVAAGKSVVATNSQTTFLCYFFVLALSARRFEVPLALLGSGLVIGEYAILAAVGYLIYDVPHGLADPDLGAFDWSTQIARACFLVATAGLTAATSIKARKNRETSIRDPLLGIYNRSYFEEILALEFEYSRRKVKSMTVVMMDLDGFEAYANARGHVRRDRLLVAISDFLVRNLRRNDVLSRLGAGSFVFLLMETPPEGAGVMLSRLQGNMGRWLRDVLAEGEPFPSFSFGLATLDDRDREPQEVIDRASRHLGLARAAGGGVICDEEGRILAPEAGPEGEPIG